MDLGGLQLVLSPLFGVNNSCQECMLKCSGQCLSALGEMPLVKQNDNRALIFFAFYNYYL